MQAIYVSANQFRIGTDKTSEFLAGRRIRANCGGSYKYSTVQSSIYSDPDTIVTIEESILTSNLTEVHYGIVNIGEQGSFPKHSHDGNEGTGGELSFSILSDTPTTYSGVSGQYLKTTVSGIEFSDDLYTKLEVATISGSLQTNIDGKADTVHIHDDRYYTESEIGTISGSLQTNIDGKADTVHIHDDRYYTESEVDTISGTLQTDIDTKPDVEVFLVEGPPSDSIGKLDDIAVDQEIGDVYEKIYVSGTITTWNPSDKHANITLSNGNLTAEVVTFNYFYGVRATNSKTAGKWYWEETVDVDINRRCIGIGTINATLSPQVGYDVYGYGYRDDGKKWHNGSGVSFGATYTATDVIGVALDLDNNKIWFSKNGNWQASGNPSDGTNEAFSLSPAAYFPMTSLGYTGDKDTVNFGASAFAHTVPTGFVGVSSGSVEWVRKLSPDFLKLSDTPVAYDDGKYLKSTTSGIEFVEDLYTKSEVDTISGTLQTSIDSMPVTLLELYDTPTTYSGASGKYVKTTYSGIEFSDDYHFGNATNYTQIETDGKIHFFGDAQPINFTVIDSLNCDASHLAPLSMISLAAADGILTSGLDTATGSLRRIEVVGVDGGIYVKGRDKGSYTQGDVTHESYRIKIKLNTTNATWEQSGEWRIILDILSGDITGAFTVYMPPFSIMEYSTLEVYVTVDGATYAETTSRGFDVSVAGPSAAEELFSNNETTGSGIVVEVASTTGFYVGNEVFVSDTSNSEWTRIKEVVIDTSITADLTNSYTTASGAKFNMFDYTKTTLTKSIHRGLFRARIFKANETSGVQLQIPVPQQTDPTKDVGVVLQYVTTADNPGSSLVSKWRVQYLFKTLGEDIPESYQYAELVYADVTPPVTKCNYIATLATITPEKHQGKNLLAMQVVRLGVDAGDTYTGNFKLAAIITTMPWKQLGYEA